MVQNSEADPATNSKKLHRFYVLLNYIQKEGVEGAILTIVFKYSWCHESGSDKSGLRIPGLEPLHSA